LGDTAAFSFFPSKNLGGFGEGGMITTNNDRLAEKLRVLRVHGMAPKYHHQSVGINGRLDALQGAILRVKLQHLEQWTIARQSNASRYERLFFQHGLQGFVDLPQPQPDFRHVYNQYVVRVPAAHRSSLRKHLSEHGVGTEIYYPVPLHLQECFTSLGYCLGDFPNAERAAAESIALPIFPELTREQQAYVVETVCRYTTLTASETEQPAA
jgi:dTDP-4-amino-4,6-dideoxygalactose transaminase